ncbi:MFS transporter [Pseudomonas sp. CBSPBW29]|uniref:MFS transporter n=1 Tax=Pseudomonas sp. CBS TaxID=2971912 RepID=UPI0021ACB4D6|nr:MFS transporter [Pseudomonas sp. CBS]WEL42708.1 MFS transporter [Pseudomonas sp. CBSPBW29]WEL63779.1 MFS transporter [Pseudomonas sp. CBSPGW29]WEL72967.1 MFS transporter [Pseudomonas sp. CBSPCGW29]WEL74281.1 MFS transporter [Pseudomonas sp. CBSPAW29]WEL81485.1 MFS transporter [Pseudomonas sp. CBSPCAW29]WEL89981.1 MFS transporter [Pseudomonas sp. CBSPCBW29]
MSTSNVTETPSPGSNASIQQVGDVFRDVPLTREHLKCCLALFFVFAIEAWEMMIIVYTAPLIAEDLTLDALAVGNLISAMFIGMLLGSLAWGKVAERIGRKRAILWSLTIYGVISLASAFAPNYLSLYVLRLLSGVAAVGMMVVTFAHYQELLPVRHRGALTVYLASGWPIGMLLALGATVWLMPWGWRAIIVLSSMGSLWALVVALWVPESPYWLASVGRQAQAKRVIQRLSRGAVQIAESCQLQVDQSTRGCQRDLFAGAMLKVSALQILVNFTFSWGYWGLQTWLPTLLQQRGLSLPQSYGFIALSALCMIPSYVAASFLTHRFGRKKIIIGFIGASVVAGYGFANAHTLEMLYLSNFALAFFSLGAWGVWGTWIAELYPTPLRTIGYGWAIFAQRVANVLAPSLIGALVAYGASFNVTTTLINAFMLITVMLVAFIPETEGRALQ